MYEMHPCSNAWATEFSSPGVSVHVWVARLTRQSEFGCRERPTRTCQRFLHRVQRPSLILVRSLSSQRLDLWSNGAPNLTQKNLLPRRRGLPLAAVHMLQSIGKGITVASDRLSGAAAHQAVELLLSAGTCIAAAVPLLLEEQPRQTPLIQIATAVAVGFFLLNNAVWGAAAAVVAARVLHVVRGVVAPYSHVDHAALLAAMPPTAAILSKGLSTDALLVESQPTNRLRPGLLVLVNPGDAVPVDGNVVWGSSIVEVPCKDSKAPRKLPRNKGTKVLAGCVNGGTSVLVVQASCAARETEAAQQAGLRNSMGRVVLPFEMQTAAAGFMITDHKFESAKPVHSRSSRLTSPAMN